MSVQRFFVSRKISDFGNRVGKKPYATGGSVLESGGYRIHSFSSSSNINFSSGGIVECLLVAGGGGAGYDVGGGGGAGGFLYISEKNILSGTHIVSVGTGGNSGQNSSARGVNGQDSSFYNESAAGGGGGGAYSTNSTGLNGGSGGGGGGSTGASGGLGELGQGNNGGNGATSAHGGGGGGGAGSAGSNGIANIIVSGGQPIQSSFSGSSEYYSGGGFGNSDSGTLRPTGQNSSGSTIGVYGFGANGTGSPNNSPYPGNQGIIMIRYLL